MLRWVDGCAVHAVIGIGADFVPDEFGAHHHRVGGIADCASRPTLRHQPIARTYHTNPNASVPLEKSRFFACLLLSLMFKRRSLTESALRSASS